MDGHDHRQEPLELFGLAEACQLLGLSKAALGERRRRAFRRGNRLPAFPPPLAELACGPIWSRAQLDDYQREVARLRRQVEKSQRAALALEFAAVEELRAEGRRRQRANLRNQPEVAELPPRGKTRDLLAPLAGVSPRLLQDAQLVRDHAPDLYEQL